MPSSSSSFNALSNVAGANATNAALSSFMRSGVPVQRTRVVPKAPAAGKPGRAARSSLASCLPMSSCVFRFCVIVGGCCCCPVESFTRNWCMTGSKRLGSHLARAGVCGSLSEAAAGILSGFDAHSVESGCSRRRECCHCGRFGGVSGWCNMDNVAGLVVGSPATA